MALLLVGGTVSFASSNLSVATPIYAGTILLGIMWALKLLTSQSVTWSKSFLHIPVAAFAVYAVIRYFTSPLEYQSRLELFRVLTCTFLYFVAAFNFNHRRDRAILVIALLLLGIGESIFALGQVYTKATTLFGYPRYDSYYDRGSGTFFCPNHLAALLEIIVGLAIANLTLNSSAKKDLQNMVLQKVFLAFSIFVLMTGIVMTASRSGLIATILSLLVLLAWGGWNLRRFWHTTLVAGCGIALLLGLVFKTEGLTNRLLATYLHVKNVNDTTEAIRHSTLGTRLKMWESTVTMIREHPIFGTGGGTWEYFFPKVRTLDVAGNAEYAHNDFLNLLSDYGLIGFALIAVGLTCFYGHSYGLIRAPIPSQERAFVMGIAMAVTAALVHSGFDFNFHIFSIAAVFMTLLGFVAAMPESTQEENRIPLSSIARRSIAIGLIVVSGLGAWFIGYSALSHRYTVLGNEVKLNDWDQAEVYYRKAMSLDTKSPIPPLLLGDVYLNKSQWHVRPGQEQERKELAQQAVQCYEQALKLNPYYVLALNRLARAYKALQDEQHMLAVCERSTALDPNTPVIPLFLARYYLAQNDLLQAEKAAIKARTLNWGYWDRGPEDVLDDIHSRQKKQQEPGLRD